VPFIWLIGFRFEEASSWIEQHLPPLLDPSQRVESVHIRRLEIDLSLATTDFLRLLPFFLRTSDKTHVWHGICALSS
jgi:hypothetical protein